MKKINLVELMKETKKNMDAVSVDFVTDHMMPFNSEYLCDAVSEFADSNTSIYYSDIAKYMSENIEHVNDTISEFGWDGCGSDLYKAGQLAEYTDIQNKIYSDMEDVLTLAAADFIRDAVGDVIDSEKWEAVQDAMIEPERIDDFYEPLSVLVNEWMGEEQEENTFAAIVDTVAAAVPSGDAVQNPEVSNA